VADGIPRAAADARAIRAPHQGVFLSMQGIEERDTGDADGQIRLQSRNLAKALI
jgi:hypothetical protein